MSFGGVLPDGSAQALKWGRGRSARSRYVDLNFRCLRLSYAGGRDARGPSEELQRSHSVSILMRPIRINFRSILVQLSLLFRGRRERSTVIVARRSHQDDANSFAAGEDLLSNKPPVPLALFNVFLFQFASLALPSIDLCVCLLPTAHFFLATPIPT
jgi:hypothetical protein